MDAFVGEIRMFGGTFAPVGWLFCDGSLVTISTNPLLFQLIGTTYGGDGQNTFGLPNLLGRVPVHQGGGQSLGQTGGTETVTLATAQLPVHTHAFQASRDAPNAAGPGNALVATGTVTAFRDGSATAAMGNGTVGFTGGQQPHTNLQPFLCVNFIIATEGIFPSPG